MPAGHWHASGTQAPLAVMRFVLKLEGMMSMTVSLIICLSFLVLVHTASIPLP